MSKPEKQRRARWRLDDLIAYECALAKDDHEEWAVLRERDAAIGLAAGVESGGSRRWILRQWLRKRLEQYSSLQRVAGSVSQSLSVAGQLLAGAGFLVGLGAATAALAYNGQAPINVSAFFSVFILLQALLAVVLLLVFFMPRRWREFFAFGPLFRFLRWILEGAFNRIQAMVGRILTGEQRQEAAEVAGSARRAVSLHGSLSKWVAFVKIQAAALFFNFGALAALLFAVVFSDRAFGWQTTLQVSGESVHFLVRLVALPWSWLYGEGVGYPDLSQVQGSRIVLKEGIQTLQSGNLSAWWGFLALGIVCYGILPRLVFYVLGKWQVRAALRRFDFGNAASERLMERLLPRSSRFVAEEVAQGSGPGATEDSPPDQPLVESGPGIRCFCAAELAESFDHDALRQALGRLWRKHEAFVKLVFYEGGRMDAPVGELRENEQVAILFESWMPPIREHDRQVKSLRNALEPHVLIKLVLLGIPQGEDEAVSLRPERQYLKTWKSFVRSIGDPYLMLENPGE